MTLTVRLDTALEQRFTATVRRQRRTKSEVVTQLLTQYLEAREPKSVYQVALDLGVFDEPTVDTPPDLARNHKKYYLAALQKKHRR